MRSIGRGRSKPSSRYYDPEVGRFINSDDVSFIGATGSEISYNPFAYCENNPVNEFDYNGTALSLFVSMAIGAVLGVLGLYIMDVIYNLLVGRYKWKVPCSSLTEYISAAVSGAISMIGIKKLSYVLSGAISGISYVIEQWTQGKRVSLFMLFTTVGVAILTDVFFPGDGIDLSNRVSIIKTSKQKLKTLVSKKKIALYKQKIVSNISAIIESAFSNLLSNVVSYAAGKSKILKRTAKLFDGVWKVVRI